MKGLLVDTTWKVMPGYVSSILMGAAKNTGIPLSIAFGKGETKSLYLLHILAFKRKLNINIEDFVIESDQGKAIDAICLRHLLVSLKCSQFSYSVGELLKCRCEKDYEQAKKTFTDEYKTINDQKKLKSLNKLLDKIGLHFDKKNIIEKDKNRWENVSMLHRSSFTMPSTTNSLEATHGHLNRKTPRNNGFWSSIYRLAYCLRIDEEFINDKILHSYNHLKRKTTNKQTNMTFDTLRRQILFYQTTIDNCQCGDNKIESSLHGIDIPCVHRIKLGAKFPECPRVKLVLNEKFDKLIIDYNPVIPDDLLNTYDEEHLNKEYAIKIIL